MVSAEQQKAANRRLDQWIDSDKRIVTFREVSREIGCHVNTAKNILLRYLNAHPTLAPTYILSGPLKSTSKLAQTQLEPIGPASPGATQSLAHLATQGVKIVDMDQMSDADRNSEPDEADEMGMRNEDGWPGNDEGAEDGLVGDGVDGMDREDDVVVNEEVPRWGMVLVQGDLLEEKKELFDTTSLSVHIYALGPAPDPAMYLIPATTLRAHKSYVKPEVYGTITGEGFKPAPGAALKDGGMQWGASSSTKKKDEPVKADKKDTKGPKSEATPADEKKLEAKKLEVKKEEAEEPKKVPPAKARAPKEDKSAPKSSQKASQKSKKRVIMSDDDEEEEEEPRAPVAGSSKPPPAPTSSMTRADDTAAMEAMLDMDFEMSAGEEDEENHAPKAKPKKAGQVDTESVIKVKTEPGQRKRRKIKDKVTEMDAKGYMVTRDVWREESYSGESEPETESQTKAGKSASKKLDEPAKRPEPTKAAPSKPAAKPVPKPAVAGKKGGQSTLAGFFTKK